MTFKPINIAFNVFEPSGGADGTLAPIIFLHGLTASKEFWFDIPQKIADKTKRTAYACDARNHGESERSDEFSFDLNIDDLFHFMDSKNFSKAILIGHSMGGITAIHAAMRKPERFEKIFVEDMYVKKSPKEFIDGAIPLLNMRKQSTFHIPKELSDKEAVEFSNNFIISKIPKESPFYSKVEDIRKSRPSFKRNSDGSFDVNFNFDVIIRALKDYDALLSEPRGRYGGPAYFIYGQLSMFAVHTEEESIRKHFPNAELIAIPGAEHNVHSEFPNEFTESVLNNL